MFIYCLQEILNKLPKRIKNDIYFQNLKSIVLNELCSVDVNMLCDIGVAQKIYEELDVELLNYTYPINDALVYALYSLDGIIVEFGVRKEKDAYLVQLTKVEKGKETKTILVKYKDKSLIETIESERDLGYYKNYDIEIYCYDNLYKELEDVDIEAIKDSLFAQQFCLAEDIARSIRKHFQDFAFQVSNIGTSLKMMRSDADLSQENLFLFREPFYLRDFKNYMCQEYAKFSVADGKKVYDMSLINDLVCIDRIDLILFNLVNLIGEDSYVIISDNIFRNLSLVLSGYAANAINTSGVIMKKSELGFIMYSVNITSNNVSSVRKELTLEEAREIYDANPLNSLVEGLNDFFDVRNR